MDRAEAVAAMRPWTMRQRRTTGICPARLARKRRSGQGGGRIPLSDGGLIPVQEGVGGRLGDDLTPIMQQRSPPARLVRQLQFLRPDRQCLASCPHSRPSAPSCPFCLASAVPCWLVILRRQASRTRASALSPPSALVAMPWKRRAPVRWPPRRPFAHCGASSGRYARRSPGRGRHDRSQRHARVRLCKGRDWRHSGLSGYHAHDPGTQR